jgi:Helicase associated domain
MFGIRTMSLLLSRLFRTTQRNVVTSFASLSSRLLRGSGGDPQRLNYQQHNNCQHRIFSTSKTMQLVEKDFFLEGTNSLVQIAGHDDHAGIMVGRGSIKPTKPYQSHKQHWIGETGHDWPTECSVEGCTNIASYGARIFRNGSTSCWIVPMCRSCSFRPDNIIEMIQSENSSFQHPFKLKEGTICLEVDSINIQSQVDNDSDRGRWREKYKLLLAYKEEYGDAHVPYTYVTPDGVNLGFWISNQRQLLGSCIDKNGNIKPGTSTSNRERINQLNDIGFIWDGAGFRNQEWEEHFNLLLSYKNEHQHLRIPRSYITPTGVKLGFWVDNQRQRLKPCMDKNGKVKPGTDSILQERIDLLKKNGFLWDIRDFEWEENFNLLLTYKSQYQHVRIPRSYVTPNGVNLGLWVMTQREILKPFLDTDGNVKPGTDNIHQERIYRLKAIGFVWVIRTTTLMTAS